LVSPDLKETEIDDIWKRIQKTIDVSKLKNKTQLYKKVKENTKTRYWNRKINSLVWDFETLKPIFKEEVGRIIKTMIDVKPSKKQGFYTRLKGRKWLDSEINFAKNMRQDGLNVRQISINLKRTPSSVYTKFSRLKGGK